MTQQTAYTELAVVSATPLDFIRIANERGDDAQKISALLEVYKNWESYEAEKKYAAAMHACQQAMPRVVKDARNAQTNSDYARLETIKDTCKPIWLSHGFTLSFGETDCPLADHKRTTVDVRHNAGACKNYLLDLPNDGIGPKGNPIGGMNRVQGAISTTSYAERRLTCMVFDITIGGEDDDGNAAGGNAKITEEQANELLALIQSKGQSVDRLCAWAEVTDLRELTVDQFRKAKGSLAAK